MRTHLAASPRHLATRACLTSPPCHPCVPILSTQPPVRPHLATLPPVRARPVLTPPCAFPSAPSRPPCVPITAPPCLNRGLPPTALPPLHRSHPLHSTARAASPLRPATRACPTSPLNRPCGLTSPPNHPCVPNPPSAASSFPSAMSFHAAILRRDRPLCLSAPPNPCVGAMPPCSPTDTRYKGEWREVFGVHGVIQLTKPSDIVLTTH